MVRQKGEAWNRLFIPLDADGVNIRTDVPANVLLRRQNGIWMYMAMALCQVIVGKKKLTY